jgi:hypothetical protein
MKVDMRTLELGLVSRQVVEVAPPGHTVVCGREKSLEGLPLLLYILNQSIVFFCDT